MSKMFPKNRASSSLKDRKAQVGMGVKPIVGVIVAVIVILAIIAAFMAMLGIFTSKADQQTESFFNNFLNGIEALAHPDTPDGTACYLRGSLNEDFGLMMFNAKKDSLNQECGGDEGIDKPSGCGGKRVSAKGCICYCDVGWQGSDDDDCDEEGAKCENVDFLEFKYPSHNEYDNLVADDDYTWWTGMESGWPGGVVWGDGHIYNYDCGGPVWRSGINAYVMKKVGTTLYIKRVPEGQTIGNENVPTADQLGIITCQRLYTQRRQARGGN